MALSQDICLSGWPLCGPCLDFVNMACTCKVCKIQSWKAGSSRGVGQLGPAGSQLLMWLTAWLVALRCWRDGAIQWPQATTEVGRMPPPSEPPSSLSSGAQCAWAVACQFFRLAHLCDVLGEAASTWLLSVR